MNYTKELARALGPFIAADGHWGQAGDLAKKMLPEMRLRHKGAVGGFGHGDLADSYADYVGGIFTTAQEHGGGAFEPLRALAPKGRYHDRLFIPSSSPGGSIVAESAAIPVGSYALSGSTLTPVKAASIAVGDRGACRNPEGLEWLAREMVQNMLLAVDTRTCVILRAACTPSAATDDPVGDIATLAAAVIASGFARPLFIAPPAVARTLATWRGTGDNLVFPDMGFLGGEVLGIPVAVTAGQISDELTLVDASGILTAAGALEIAMSENALIEMNSAPEMNSQTGASGASNLVSAFQVEAVAIKSVRDFALTVLRSSSVAVIENIAWGEAS